MSTNQILYLLFYCEKERKKQKRPWFSNNNKTLTYSCSADTKMHERCQYSYPNGWHHGVTNAHGHFSSQQEVSIQCDQMVILFFKIWPFAVMKISPIMSQFAKVCSAFCQIRNILSKIWPFTYKLLPKWRNLDKSGHSVSITQCLNLLSMPRPEALDWLGRLLFSRS